MKAVILAGGKGTRGKPYTDYFPKAMIPVNERPLIHHIVNYVNSFKIIDEVIIVADFKDLGGQIKNYFENIEFKKKIKFVQDSQSGTAGDLRHVSDLLKKNSEFLLWFVDNLCSIDLKKMFEYYKKKQCIACIATRRNRKEETGFAVVENGIIQEFKEKPVIKLQMAECLGIYILGTSIIKKIKDVRGKNNNLSFDILQKLSKKQNVSAFDIGNKYWLDVESPVVIERSKTIVNKIIKEMEC